MAMSQREREDFIALMAREGVKVEHARYLMRCGSTLHRLSEAQCNGDWPCDNGQRKVEPCAECESLYVRSVLLKGKRCPECRLTARVKAFCQPLGLEPVFGGDPRGAVLLIKVPSGKTNDWGQRGLVAG